MHRSLLSGFMFISCTLLQGCATSPAHDSTAYAPARPTTMSPPTPANGAIYQENFGIALFEDRKAQRTGDILTIVLVEKTAATKKASTNTSKGGKVAVDNPTILGIPFSFNAPFNNPLDLNLQTGVSSDQTFKGEGDSSLSNSLNGRISVTVTEVLANGNLIVKGEKLLTLNQGDEYVRFSGIVRSQDVRPDNTVSSTLVADAKIVYLGDGAVADANSMGLLSRFFNKFWPF